MRAWIRLARVYGRITRALETHAREHELSLGQFDVLAQVARDEGQTQQEIANRLLVTKGNISHLVDRLERARLMERRAGRGRVCHLFLTAAGRTLLAEFVPSHTAIVHEMFASLSLDDLVELHETLRDLDLALE